MSLPSITELRPLIRSAAHAELLPRFTAVSRDYKADGSIVTEADLAMQTRLTEELSRRWPEIPLLGEEMSEAEQARLLAENSAGLWCLDPLDGTSNYAAGIPYFGVSLALIRNGEIVLGLVYDPVRDECFHAVRGEGAWMNDQRLAAPDNALPLAKAIGLVDFKRLPKPLAARLASEPPYSSQRSFGSGALDWCWLACGRVQVYLHGRQRLWDYAAGSLILAEAGGQAQTLEGESVFRGELKGRSVVATLDRALFSAWRAWLGNARY